MTGWRVEIICCTRELQKFSILLILYSASTEGLQQHLNKQPLSEALQLHISKAVCSKKSGLTSFGWITSKSRYILIEQSVL